MVKFIFEWIILAPASVAADLLVIALALLPVAAGLGAWIGVYKLLSAPPNPMDAVRHRWQTKPAIAAWIAGIYVALVFYASFTKLPATIGKYLSGH